MWGWGKEKKVRVYFMPSYEHWENIYALSYTYMKELQLTWALGNSFEAIFALWKAYLQNTNAIKALAQSLFS